MKPVTVAHAVHEPSDDHLWLRTFGANGTHVSAAPLLWDLIRHSLNDEIERQIRDIAQTLARGHRIQDFERFFSVLVNKRLAQLVQSEVIHTINIARSKSQ